MGLGDTHPAILLLILSTIPMTWAETFGVWPTSFQTSLIIAAAVGVILVFRHTRKVRHFALLFPAYLLTTLITNLLIMRIWDM
jgi:hypothetical protein